MATTVKWSKSFKPRVPGEGALLAAIGRRGAAQLTTRIRDEGEDADGEPLPPLSQRANKQRWTTNQTDKRFHGVGRWAQVARKNPPYQEGDVRILWDRTGKVRYDKVFSSYAAAKEALGAEPRRNLSLTGAMWKALTVQVSGSQKKRKIKLYFAGSDKAARRAVIKDGAVQKTDKGATVQRSMRHRDKARLAMYGKQTSTGEQKGNQLFQLMRLSQNELEEMAQTYRRAIRLFE